MEEIWKDVVGWVNWYKVSNMGRIKSVRSGCGTWIGRILKPYKDKKGYLIVKLCKNNVDTSMRVNRLVAMTFLDNPHNKELVHHKNAIKDHNWSDNLEWVTNSENQLYAANDFGNSRGERCGKAKLKEFEVLEILKLTKTTNLTHASISKQYNISVQTVHNISMRRTWRHLDAMKG